MLDSFLAWLLPHLNLLTLFGAFGQALFFMRFAAQWVASEKSQRSVIPEVFWYFSFGGGLILFVYCIIKDVPVLAIGQGAGLFVYIRNIALIWNARLKRRATTHEAVFEALQARAADLATRHREGTPISHEERKAAAEALHVLEAAKK
jgi:lipid-A-disaccharide synthase-like uncharacterized protein